MNKNKCVPLILFVVFAVSFIYSIEIPEELKVPDEKNDYRIRVANRYLKCINAYVNCENNNDGSFACDNEFLGKCLDNSVKRHIQVLMKMKKSKIVVEEFQDAD